MSEALKRYLIEHGLTEEERARFDSLPVRLNSAGMDDWGFEPRTAAAAAASIKLLYSEYFRVATHGIENVPEGRVLLVANHGGQLPLDGFLVGMAMVLEGKPPRIARGMVERFFPALPFISTLLMRCGQMVGDIRNCKALLEDDQCVLVFPEGTRGSGKLYTRRYELQRMGTGFARLALETGTPIVPVGIIGCEETYPAILHLKRLARAVGAPYLPVTPFFPLLGPLGLLPLPTRVTLRFGKPIRLEGDPDAADSVVERQVDEVRAALKAEIDEGLRLRGGRIFSGKGA